jgi:hypothetical protein
VSREKSNDKKQVGTKYKARDCYGSTPLLEAEWRGRKKTDYGVKEMGI